MVLITHKNYMKEYLWKIPSCKILFELKKIIYWKAFVGEVFVLHFLNFIDEQVKFQT